MNLMIQDILQEGSLFHYFSESSQVHVPMESTSFRTLINKLWKYIPLDILTYVFLFSLTMKNGGLSFVQSQLHYRYSTMTVYEFLHLLCHSHPKYFFNLNA